MDTIIYHCFGKSFEELKYRLKWYIEQNDTMFDIKRLKRLRNQDYSLHT